MFLAEKLSGQQMRGGLMDGIGQMFHATRFWHRTGRRSHRPETPQLSFQGDYETRLWRRTAKSCILRCWGNRESFFFKLKLTTYLRMHLFAHNKTLQFGCLFFLLQKIECNNNSLAHVIACLCLPMWTDYALRFEIGIPSETVSVQCLSLEWFYSYISSYYCCERNAKTSENVGFEGCANLLRQTVIIHTRNSFVLWLYTI